jgi:hypothetical protein
MSFARVQLDILALTGPKVAAPVAVEATVLAAVYPPALVIAITW